MRVRGLGCFQRTIFTAILFLVVDPRPNPIRRSSLRTFSHCRSEASEACSVGCKKSRDCEGGEEAAGEGEEAGEGSRELKLS
jgi:hypothetical protein